MTGLGIAAFPLGRQRLDALLDRSLRVTTLQGSLGGPGTGGGRWEVFGKITIFYGYVSLAEGKWFCWDILT